MGIRASIVQRPKSLVHASDGAIIEWVEHNYTEENPAKVSEAVYNELAKRPGLALHLKLLKVQARLNTETAVSAKPAIKPPPLSPKQTVIELLKHEAGQLEATAREYDAAVKSGKFANHAMRPEAARNFAREFRIRADALRTIIPSVRRALD